MNYEILKSVAVEGITNPIPDELLHRIADLPEAQQNQFIALLETFADKQQKQFVQLYNQSDRAAIIAARDFISAVCAQTS